MTVGVVRDWVVRWRMRCRAASIATREPLMYLWSSSSSRRFPHHRRWLPARLPRYSAGSDHARELAPARRLHQRTCRDESAVNGALPGKALPVLIRAAAVRPHRGGRCRRPRRDRDMSRARIWHDAGKTVWMRVKSVTPGPLCFRSRPGRITLS